MRLQHARHHLALTHGAIQLAGELLLESLITSIGDSNNAASVAATAAAASRRVHMWGTPASLGMFLMQLNYTIPQQQQPMAPNATSNNASLSSLPLQTEASLDNVQLEWSQQFASFIAGFVR